ncbi:uncharacterized protein LOC130963039 [Arachis stenosperma]|uniref:uncharacterized protein LOC130963039 n=1 Tax=Arachis stenosperma TaxID=217475 RepID=UPI0025AB96A1|nr:uncharacterized protein LOC130963039 [Arachis stenosperma]
MEDEPYKPPPPGYNDDSDDENSSGEEKQDLHTPVSSDEEAEKQYWPEFHDEYGFGEGHFEVGTKFATLDDFKEVVKDLFIFEGRQLQWIKNDKERVRVDCKGEECPWVVHVSYNNSLRCFQVKTFKSEHTCARDIGSNAADQHWLSNKIEKRLAIHLQMTRKEASDFLKDEFGIHHNDKMVYRALKEARDRIVGSESEQYGKLRDYLFELLRSNPGSTALLEGDFGGQLLSAIAQDANNHFYTIAYAVVGSETKESWKWFLTLLQEDLGNASVHGWNFMSDQQKMVFKSLNKLLLSLAKAGAAIINFSLADIPLYTIVEGLLEAMKEVMPEAPHHNCVMHMWKNFINRFKDLQVRDVVWECASCSTPPEFVETMEKLKKINEEAWEYLTRFDPRVWVKVYLNDGPKVDSLTNNMCESWNAKIEKDRVKPILTMCEELHCYVMRRMTKHITLLSDYPGKLAPVQQKRLGRLIKPSNRWNAVWTGDNERKQFEVSRKTSRVDVDLMKHTCSCNMWQLIGMPCVHVIAAIRKKHDKPEDYVHKWLCMESIYLTYAHSIQPVPSEEYWHRTGYIKPNSPPIKRPIGRPKVHKRKKDPIEDLIQGDKVRKTFRITCSKCGEKGHNYKSAREHHLILTGSLKPGNQSTRTQVVKH